MRNFWTYRLLFSKNLCTDRASKHCVVNNRCNAARAVADATR